MRGSSFFLLLPPPSSPDLICQLLIAVSLAGSHLPDLDSNGPRRTSTGESLSAVGLAGLQPARVWSLRSSPDFNRRDSARCGPGRTSTGEIRRAVGLAGLPPARFGAPWASPGFHRRDSAHRGPRRTITGPQRPEKKPYRMPKRMPDRMPDSEDMPDRMSEDLPDRMSDGMNWMPWWGSLEAKYFFCRWSNTTKKQQHMAVSEHGWMPH